MGLTSNQKSDFLSRLRQYAADEAELRDRAQSLKREYTALDLGTVITNPDFVGSNTGLTVTDMTNTINTIDALESAFSAGHKTNIYTFRS